MKLWRGSVLLDKVSKGLMQEVTFELALDRCIESIHLHESGRHTVMKTGEHRRAFIEFGDSVSC